MKRYSPRGLTGDLEHHIRKRKLARAQKSVEGFNLVPESIL